TITIDYQLAIPDRSLSLAGGAIKPWQTGQGMECQQDLLRMCRETGIRTNVPFEKLSEAHQRWVIEGDPDYGKDEEHEWPRAWYGVKGYFRWLESRAYKMHVRVLLSRYRAYQTCPMCQGQRLQPDALLFRIPVPSAASNPNTTAPNRIDAGANPRALASCAREALTLADFYLLPIDAALDFVDQLAAKRPNQASDPVLLVLNEVRSRLRYLVEVGLGYLTLDRPTRSLSGGETERVNLTTCLGTRLVNTLYVLDEPSVGLHPRDTERLVRVLEQLRSSGNTVVVVEHEASVIRAADQIVDLGPGHGEGGGALVFQGTFEDLLESDSSLTGQYLSGRKRIEIPKRRPPPPRVPGRREHPAWLKISGATLHNLKNLAVEIPLGRFVCVSGVSGSGKTTLIREILWPALHRKLKSQPARHPFSILGKIEEPEKNQDDEPEDGIIPGVEISGWGSLSRVLLVDQSALGRTPRSNPAVYIGAFDDLRDLFAQSDAALQRGLNASAFSFNSSQGQCERCRGAGFEKIEM
ncbi:MAG: excinuclease ABC subunit A, partial [Verrucomicrobiota bacterium]